MSAKESDEGQASHGQQRRTPFGNAFMDEARQSQQQHQRDHLSATKNL